MTALDDVLAVTGGLVSHRIEFRNRSCPHAPVRSITVRIRCGQELDADCLVGFVAARIPTRLVDVKIVQMLGPDAGQWVPVDREGSTGRIRAARGRA